jgi:hypothetical protein
MPPFGEEEKSGSGEAARIGREARTKGKMVCGKYILIPAGEVHEFLGVFAVQY